MQAAASKVEFDKKLRIIPFSDLHLTANASAEKKFNKLVQWILSKPDTYAIGLGDYADAVVRQDIKRYAAGVTKPELMSSLDSLLNANRDYVIKALKPLADAGRLLGLAEGNHEESIKKHHSYDILRDVCNTLNVPYLGYSFLYRLTVRKKSRDTQKNVVIYGHHGFGASRKGGAAMNRREDILCKYDADIVLMGHDHHKFGRRLIRISMTGHGKPRLVHKPVIIAATGSFLKTCIEGETTYAEKAGYPPNDLGVIRIDIDIVGESKDLDMHISE